MRNTAEPSAEALLSSPTGDVAAAIATVERLHKFELVRVDDVGASGLEAALAVVPAGKSLVDLKPYFDARRTAPERLRGIATLQTLQSFIAHVNRSKDGDTALFADRNRTAPSITAVYDYHEESEAGPSPRWLDHRGRYAFPISEEWKAWSAVDGRWLDQRAFAEFLQDRITDFVLPATVADETRILQLQEQLQGIFGGPSAIASLARGLSLTVAAEVHEALSLETGEITVKFVETHRDATGAPIKTPNLFALAIPVFDGGEPYLVPLRLRYNATKGLAWCFRLFQASKRFDTAFTEACELAAVETGCPLFYGAPEA